MLTIGTALAQTELHGNDKFLSVYPALGQPFETRPASAQDLAEVAHLRFDPVSACNARCVFCHSDFDGPVRHLALDDLALIVDRPMERLHTIAVGCAFEPLMGKHFERYPAVLARFRGQAQARIITNGHLLHRRDIGPWVDFGMEYLHVSLHSHLPEVYARTMRNLDLAPAVRNLAAVRARFPDLRMIFINVVSKLNDVAVGDYCRWAFDEVGVDQVVLFRAALAAAAPAGSPAAAYGRDYLAEHGRAGALDDREWAAVVEDCAPFRDGSHAAALNDLPIPVDTLTMNRPISAARPASAPALPAP